MKSLTTSPAPVGTTVVPESVQRADFVEALRPLFALLGLNPEDAALEGFEVTGDSISFLSIAPLADAQPSPSFAGEDVALGTWTWPVHVEVSNE